MSIAGIADGRGVWAWEAAFILVLEGVVSHWASMLQPPGGATPRRATAGELGPFQNPVIVAKIIFLKPLLD